MNVLALVAYPLDTAPGQRYRIEQWAPYLAEQGIHVTFMPFASPELGRTLYEPGRFAHKAGAMILASIRRYHDLGAARHFDLVWVFREACLVGPAWAEQLAHFRGSRLIYDFDDAIYLPYVSPSNRYLSYLKFPGKTRSLCRLSKAVFAGNSGLAAYARRYNPNVHVLPSTISLRSYRTRAESPRMGPPVVGWTGSHSSAPYLDLIANALRRLRARRAFRFLAIGLDRLTIPGVEVECRRWTSQAEVRDLWDMDVGVMPLRDDPWSQGKCGMKLLQYMGVGLPAVASPVGVNREIIRAGENGFLPATEDDWVEVLDSLLADSDLRRRLGAEARRTVETDYSAEVHVPRLASVLRGAA